MGIHGDSWRIHERFIRNSKDSWTKKFPLEKLGCLASNFAAECFNKQSFSSQKGQFGPFATVYMQKAFLRLASAPFLTFLAYLLAYNARWWQRLWDTTFVRYYVVNGTTTPCLRFTKTPQSPNLLSKTTFLKKAVNTTPNPLPPESMLRVPSNFCLSPQHWRRGGGGGTGFEKRCLCIMVESTPNSTSDFTPNFPLAKLGFIGEMFALLPTASLRSVLAATDFHRLKLSENRLYSPWKAY